MPQPYSIRSLTTGAFAHQTDRLEVPGGQAASNTPGGGSRDGAELLIDREADFVVADEAANGAQAIERGRLQNLDVVVMDLSMPGVSGVVATRKLKELRPDLPIVILTRHADETFLQELLRA